MQGQCSRWGRKRVADEIARCQVAGWRPISHRSPRGAPSRGDEALGLSARWTLNRTRPLNGTTPSATGARTSASTRCGLIRGTPSVGSPTTANAQAGFAFHAPTPRRPVREPVFTTPRDLPPHGKTVEAPYSKLGARTSVSARCACIRGTRSVGSPTTANAQAGFAFHAPTRRRPVREPVFTTPRDLPPHGKTVEAPYSKLGLRHTSGLVRERDVQRGGAGLVVACRILRSIR